MTPTCSPRPTRPRDVTRPLAVRMRPATLDEVVGAGPCAGARLAAAPTGEPRIQGVADRAQLVILFGPPGVGKTTLAYIVAKQSGRVFEELSAVTSGVKDVRAVLDRAHRRLVAEGKETVLFIDEVHRFSKSQQDALLPSVENRDVTFIAATTENPSFSVIKPLLSRSVVVSSNRSNPMTSKPSSSGHSTIRAGSRARSGPLTMPSTRSCAWPAATHARP